MVQNFAEGVLKMAAGPAASPFGRMAATPPSSQEQPFCHTGKEFPPPVQNTGHNPNLQHPGGASSGHPVPIAPGFQTIVSACQKLYPEQRNPLQLSTVVKYWLGGTDPLDYITVYSNNQEGSCYPHWHYVSCGLTDLHGDGRVHPPAPSPMASSGYGFELTFRLRRREELVPPSWPVKVIQKIAKYVFETDNTLVPGDHITWADRLGSSSLLKHLLISEDSQLTPVISGPLGSFRFLQLMCCSEEELKAVQRWNGPGVLRLLQSSDITGGQFLITDIERSFSLFEAVLEAKAAVEAGISREGSNLCGMAAFITWEERKAADGGYPLENLGGQGHNPLTDWNDLSSQCDKVLNGGLNSKVLTYPASVEIVCNLETARYLPLCVQGRLKHGYHFTLKSVVKDTAVTFLTEGVGGTHVSTEQPFAGQGDWLQLLIQSQDLEEFYKKVSIFEQEFLNLPITLYFQRFVIRVVSDVDQLKS
jgi:suppressor of fused-like protein